MRQEERRARTRTAIVAAARKRFGEVGFADTTIDGIAAAADVAKGAVYHHFASKEALFASVFEAVSTELVAKVAASARPEADPLDNLVRATRTYFALCADPPVARITLQDAPGVLGYERWRQLDAAHFGGLVSGGLQAAMRAGAIDEQPLAPLANIVLAAIQAAALDCAAQDDFETAAEAYLQSFVAILQGLAASD